MSFGGFFGLWFCFRAGPGGKGGKSSLLRICQARSASKSCGRVLAAFPPASWEKIGKYHSKICTKMCSIVSLLV